MSRAPSPSSRRSAPRKLCQRRAQRPRRGGAPDPRHFFRLSQSRRRAAFVAATVLAASDHASAMSARWRQRPISSPPRSPRSRAVANATLERRQGCARYRDNRLQGWRGLLRQRPARRGRRPHQANIASRPAPQPASSLNATIEAARARGGQGLRGGAIEVQEPANQPPRPPEEDHRSGRRDPSLHRRGGRRDADHRLHDLHCQPRCRARSRRRSSEQGAPCWRCPQHTRAAKSASDVAQNIGGVGEAAGIRVLVGASGVTAATRWRRRPRCLRAEVDAFLGGIRAALSRAEKRSPSGLLNDAVGLLGAASARPASAHLRMCRSRDELALDVELLVSSARPRELLDALAISGSVSTSIPELDAAR